MEAGERQLVRGARDLARRAPPRVALDELAHVIVVGGVAGEHVGDVHRVAARAAVVYEAQHVVHEEAGLVRGAGVARREPEQVAVQEAALALHEVVVVRRRDRHDVGEGRFFFMTGTGRSRR